MEESDVPLGWLKDRPFLQTEDRIDIVVKYCWIERSSSFGNFNFASNCYICGRQLINLKAIAT